MDTDACESQLRRGSPLTQLPVDLLRLVVFCLDTPADRSATRLTCWSVKRCVDSTCVTWNAIDKRSNGNSKLPDFLRHNVKWLAAIQMSQLRSVDGMWSRVVHLEVHGLRGSTDLLWIATGMPRLNSMVGRCTAASCWHPLRRRKSVAGAFGRLASLELWDVARFGHTDLSTLARMAPRLEELHLHQAECGGGTLQIAKLSPRRTLYPHLRVLRITPPSQTPQPPQTPQTHVVCHTADVHTLARCFPVLQHLEMSGYHLLEDAVGGRQIGTQWRIYYLGARSLPLDLLASVAFCRSLTALYLATYIMRDDAFDVIASSCPALMFLTVHRLQISNWTSRAVMHNVCGLTVREWDAAAMPTHSLPCCSSLIVQRLACTFPRCLQHLTQLCIMSDTSAESCIMTPTIAAMLVKEAPLLQTLGLRMCGIDERVLLVLTGLKQYGVCVMLDCLLAAHPDDDDEYATGPLNMDSVIMCHGCRPDWSLDISVTADVTVVQARPGQHIAVRQFYARLSTVVTVRDGHTPMYRDLFRCPDLFGCIQGPGIITPLTMEPDLSTWWQHLMHSH
jgi:hypothetical protein